MVNQVDKNKTLIQHLLDKSQEAFIMAVEIYNKPTLKYRVEGFSFFICNAWELLLKAYLLNTMGPESIYYKDSNTRTLSLENCVKKVLTNKYDPLRNNLEKIIELRNISTHFIIEEYELLYVPLFQATVINYTNKLLAYFSIDITDSLNSNFLTLSIKLSALSETDIQARYPKEISGKLFNTKRMLDDDNQFFANPNFAITIHHDWVLTKNPKKATATFSIAKGSDDAVYVMKQNIDPQKSHPFSAKNCLKAINKSIQKENIDFTSPNCNTIPAKFNMHHFQLFLKYYDAKTDESLCYTYKISTQPKFSYSEKLIKFIINKIKENPEYIIIDLKQKLDLKQELTQKAKK